MSTAPSLKQAKPVKTKTPYQLTPEQVALQKARAELKAQKAAVKAEEPLRTQAQIDKGKFLKREWVDLLQSDKKDEGAVRVLSWNVLAQTLIRRDLFPGSDCLKWADREQMLISEFTEYAADIICLQEVDRLDSLLPHLTTYKVTQAKGLKKRHGLVILHQDSMFEQLATKVVYLDELEVRDDDGKGRSPAYLRAGTRETKNIGLLTCLKRKDGKGGVIVFTTHAFWHPLYMYERTRQIGLCLRETIRFREAGGWSDWPCIMAGDFNTQPFEPSYFLLRNPTFPLSASQTTDIRNSSVIHSSVINVKSQVQLCDSTSGKPEYVEPNTKPSALKETDEEDERDEEGEGEGEGEGQEGIMKGCRVATPEDGLLSIDELRALFVDSTRGDIKSLYDEASRIEIEGGKAKEKASLEGRSLEGRLEDGSVLHAGRGEPNYTSYTPLWHLTLDYIFLISGLDKPPPKVVKYLLPHKVSDLQPGLPRKGVSASDHVLVSGDVVFES